MNRQLIKNFAALFLVAIFFAFTISVGAQNAPSASPIDLLWSTNAYTPPLYQGKALPIRESTIEIAAITYSTDRPDSELFFSWYLNNQLMREESGRGKNTFSFECFRPSCQVRLRLQDDNKLPLADKEISIPLVSPEVVLEKRHFSLDGPRLSGAFALISGQESSFFIQPYFFNINQPEELAYEWRLGDKKAQNTSGENPQELVLRVDNIKKIVSGNLFFSAIDSQTNQSAKNSALLYLIPQNNGQ